MKNKDFARHLFRVLLSCALAFMISALALLALAHRSGASTASFSPSQIYALTGNEKKEAEFASKIGEELSELLKDFN